MKKRMLVAVATLALVAGGCSSTFVVNKEGKGYFWGSDSMAAYRMLCESGDLKKVLSDTNFSQEMRDKIYKYNCSSERSGEKVRQIYASMTQEERKELRTAFKKNGFEINYMYCCGDVINTTSPLR